MWSVFVYELPKPEFKELGDSFRVNFYRHSYGKTERKKPIEKANKKQTQIDQILHYVEINGSINNTQARELLHLAESTVKRILRDMVEEEVLQAIGERRYRIYTIKTYPSGKKGLL